MSAPSVVTCYSLWARRSSPRRSPTAPQLGGPTAWLAAGSFALFVVGVTWISRSEVESGKNRGLVAGLVLQGLAMLALFATCWQFEWARSMSPPKLAVNWSTSGLIVVFAVVFFVQRAGLAAYRRPVPETFQKAVKTGVLALVWLDVAAVAASRGPGTALVVASLWVPAFLLGRWL